MSCYISKEQALADFTQQRIADGQPDLTDYIRNPFPNQLSVKLQDPRQSSQVMSVLDAQRGAVVANVIETAEGHRQAGQRHGARCAPSASRCWRWSA